MRPLSELPNTGGFRFVGIRHDGSRVECVLRYFGGLLCECEVTPNMEIPYPRLAGWECADCAKDPSHSIICQGVRA